MGKLSRLMKNSTAVARDLLTWQYFYDHRKGPRYRGVYGSYQEAEAAMPRNGQYGFHDDVPEFFQRTQLAFNQNDYPVLLWMSQALEPDATIFDFGGGLGQCYYTYQGLIPFPEGLRWTVCDVESFIAEGPKMAAERGAENLFFTSDRSQASGATVFLTNGTLQYVENDLWTILSGLPEPPEHVLVNRVPMYEGEAYYTVQSSLHSFIPYRIMNSAEFIEGMSKAGYTLIDQWKLPRSVYIPLHYKNFVPHFRGMYFRRKQG
ncbi:methyltransferase, TIGR04325 family [Paracidobacterium acidisoli]|uniref:Methyltransferase, TIGR04325 family n=1 Tax=Paracidobacterium acidisoli TaxID=2303751 RepID=A0A372IKY3_9BACT|nr:methyltransferase, TIGR04325 family [Paracidobacterium acidisoli]MBT9332593.1 methyltransferase, TIGR04325 family [Paracidobacterium acidisoli]